MRFTILEVADNTNRGYYMGLYNGLYRLGSLGGMLLGGILADQYGISVTAIFLGPSPCWLFRLQSGPFPAQPCLSMTEVSR
ncbi:hypothetical protein [Sporomusa termitida]|uniref:hypothetical protein n=1 Tax=Sporomusa termitida TaxID=2377 RepID=UPI001186410B|nr:hypothetical protein [Sporomusa termitida]